MNSAERFYLPVDGILEMFSSLSGFTHHPVSNVSKAGMGIIKTVKGCWGRRDKTGGAHRSSSSGIPRGSADRLPRVPVQFGVTKPRNCRRIVVLGAPRVGKTNILRRFLGEEFEEHYEPTIEDFYRKLFYIGGEAYQVDLLDAARERDFPAKRRLSILTGDVFLLVFSLDDRESLNEVHKLQREVTAAKAKIHKPARAVKLLVCGNKADLDQRVVAGSEVGQILGEDVPFFETSAKDGTGLEAVFAALATLGGLPHETSPSRHQIISILTYQSLCVGRRGRRRRRLWRGAGAPCAAVDPVAQRPSFSSDLRLVLGSSTKAKKPEVCPVQ
ncbi:GTP-binding protein Rhes [Nematolebias whitei]|uniref:GTP-binding protein Rhes n=1 Tax=Nematolebias whitei TaxID=451745 RepID=UPI001899C005|nr:GTP-binding protein Rhes [Nematolebias whitei]